MAVHQFNNLECRLHHILPSLQTYPHTPQRYDYGPVSVPTASIARQFNGSYHHPGLHQPGHESMRILLSDAPHGDMEMGFKVRPNLHSALCTFRLEGKPRTLSIDAICMNQADVVEKSARVGLTG